LEALKDAIEKFDGMRIGQNLTNVARAARNIDIQAQEVAVGGVRVQETTPNLAQMMRMREGDQPTRRHRVRQDSRVVEIWSLTVGIWDWE